MFEDGGKKSWRTGGSCPWDDSLSCSVCTGAVVSSGLLDWLIVLYRVGSVNPGLVSLPNCSLSGGGSWYVVMFVRVSSMGRSCCSGSWPSGIGRILPKGPM